MKRLLSPLFILLLFLLPLAAQEPWKACLGKPIGRLSFTGISLSQEKIVREFLQSRTGEPLSILSVDRDIKSILQLQLFDNVTADAVPEGESCELIFRITPSRFIRSIKVEGLSRRSDRMLLERVNSYLRTTFSGEAYYKEVEERAREEIDRFLKESGYSQYSLSIVIKEPSPAHLSLFFRFRIPQPPKVSRILFSGISDAEGADLRGALSVKVGDPFTLERAEKAASSLKNLLVSQGFLMATVSSSPQILQDGSSSLEFHVQKGQKVVLRILGASFNPKILSPLWGSAVFPPWAVEEGKSKLLGELRKRGFVLPKIETSFSSDESTITVEYRIHRGTRYRLGEILFQGNSSLKSDELKRAVAPFLKDYFFYSYFDASCMADMVTALEYLYWQRGFREASLKVEPKERGKNVDLLFSIQEKRQAIVESVEILGGLFFDRYYLERIAGISAQGPLSNDTILRWKNAIEREYKSKGFDDVKVDTVTAFGPSGSVRITFTIVEGERSRVKEVFWLGEPILARSLFDKSMLIKKGDLLDQARIEESMKNLENYGVFDQLRVFKIPTAPGEKLLVVQTEPGRTDFFNYGIGYGERVGFRGTVEYQRLNPFKRGNIYSFIVKLGKNENRFLFNFDTPWQHKGVFKTFFNLWYEKEFLRSYTYSREGFAVNAIHKLSGQRFITSNFRLVNTNLLSLDIAPSKVDRENSPFSTSSVSISFTQDKRDDPFNPQSGSYLSSDNTLALRFLGTTSKFFKTSGRFQKFWKFKNDVFLFNQLRWGFGGGTIPIVDRYFAGGSFSFRGSGIDGLGPRDPSTDSPLGGNTLLVNNLELTVPVPIPLPNLQFSVFYDRGNVYKNNKDLLRSGEMSNAVGVGLRYRTPLGPFRIDGAWNLDKERRKRFYVYFAIGNMF